MRVKAVKVKGVVERVKGVRIEMVRVEAVILLQQTRQLL